MIKHIHIAVLAWFAGIVVASAAVVWRPGEGWVDESSGSAMAASDSRTQLDMAKQLEEKGEMDEAYKAYKSLVRRWPLSFFAPEAQFRAAGIEEKMGDFERAYKTYQKMIEKYPSSTHFEQALDREFAIGNLYLAGEPKKLWKIPLGPSMETAVEIFESVIKNAPYGKHAAEAQFKIGLAHEKQKKFMDAVKAYNSILDKYPGNDIIDDAQYQIGYAWMSSSTQAAYDQSAAEKAIEAFQDFLVRFPNSEKVAQAQENIKILIGKKTQSSMDVAKFYENQKNYKAAFIYYNEVVRQNPDSEQAETAIKKIEQLRPIVEKDPAGTKKKPADPMPAPEPAKTTSSNQDKPSEQRP